MTTERNLKDPVWDKIYQYLILTPGIYTGNEEKCRLFVEAVFWLTRTGAGWRDIPEKFGDWNAIYKRFARWSDKNVWQNMHQHFVSDPDMEWLMLDSTIVRAHPCAAGAPKKTVDKTNKP